MARTPTTLVAPKTQKQMERKWAAESALSTITRADQIRRDPRLMSDVKALARQQVQTLTKVTGGSSRTRGRGK